MLSAWKRLTRSTTTDSIGAQNSNGSTSCGLQTMSSSLQKKFSRGIQYNMKIILKGDRNAGKSALFRRLQGLPFPEEYCPTDEIQVANIHWNYKATDDVVKVEIWDVVDKAKKKKQISQGLKLENVGTSSPDTKEIDEIALDASFLDVYKNTHGVIIIFDITKNWTFDYVKREILLIPTHIPVLILGNHRDMGHHRAISKDTVLYFIEGLERDQSCAEIRFCESSMRNGFGLKFIHKFFNLPFLKLQRETLLKQLETNADEKIVTVEEIDLHLESDDANYDLFIDGLTQKRRQIADALSSPVPKLSVDEAKALAASREKEKEQNQSSNNSIVSNATNLVVSKGKELAENISPKTEQAVSGSKDNEENSTENESKSNGALSPHITSKSMGRERKESVDDFIPDESEGLDYSFFNETSSKGPNSYLSTQDECFESSEDEDAGENPLVTNFTEDVELDDTFIKSASLNVKQHSTQSSSSAEEESLTSTKETLSVRESRNSPDEFVQNPLTSKVSKTTEKKHGNSSKKQYRHRHVSAGSKKKQIDLETFLGGNTSDTGKDADFEDYEPI